MIYVQTKLNTADNSGALKVKCIKVLNNKKIANIGDSILVSVKKINPKRFTFVFKRTITPFCELPFVFFFFGFIFLTDTKIDSPIFAIFLLFNTLIHLTFKAPEL